MRPWSPARALRLVASLATIGSLLVVAGPALADVRAEARRHFESGMESIRAGRFEEGIAELQRAYEIMPHPAVRYNMARAYQDAGQLEQARATFQQYLEGDPEDRVEVEKLVADLDRQLAERKAAAARPAPKGPSGPVGPTGPASGRASAPAPGATDRPAPAAPQPEASDLYQEQVVTASRRAQSPLDAPNSTTIVTRQDIHLSGITRIPELLRRVAGADVMQITGGDANVSLRGLNARLSNKLLVLVNGRAVKNDILGSTFWETLSIDVDQIQQIEVVRGPGSSLYGADAFAGVVNIITVPPGEGTSGFRVGLGDRVQGYGSLWATQRSGDFAYRASLGYTRYPRWTREVGPGRVDIHQADVDQNLGAENLRVDVRSSYRVAQDKDLELGGGFARSTANFYGIGPFNDYIVEADAADVSGAFKSELFTLRSNYALLDTFANANHAYLGHSRYEADPIQHSFETNAELTIGGDLPAGLHHGLITGAGYRLKRIRWNYLVDEPPIEHHVGLFAQDALRFLAHYGVVASGRLDYVPALETVMPSARGTILIQPGATKRQAIKASVATAFRTPTFLESYLDLPIQLTLSGLDLQSASKRDEDPDFRLGAENILAAEIGYLNQLSDDYQFEVAAYYHRVSDFIQLALPRQLTLSDIANGVGGLNPETGHYRVASGGWANQCAVDHAFGAEVGAHYYGVEGLDLFANYAIHYGLHDQPPGCTDPGDDRTSHHMVNVGVQGRTSFGLNGEVTFHYQTEQRWGEQVATATGIEYQLFDLPAYHLLNARVGYGFLEDDRAEVSATVFNALSGLAAPDPQMHPFGNRVGRRFMGFFSYRL